MSSYNKHHFTPCSSPSLKFTLLPSKPTPSPSPLKPQPTTSNDGEGETEIRKMICTLQNNKLKLDKVLKEIGLINQSYTSELSEIETENTKIRKFKDNLMKMMSGYYNPQKEIEKYEKKLSKKTKDYNKLKQECEKLQALQQTYTSLCNKLLSIQNEIHYLNNLPKSSEIIAAETAEQTALNAIASIQQRITTLNEQLKHVAQEITAMRDATAQIEPQMQQEFPLIESEILSRKNSVDEHTSTLTAKKEVLQENTTNLDNLNATLASLKQTNTLLQIENKNIKSESQHTIDEFKSKMNSETQVTALITPEQLTQCYQDQFYFSLLRYTSFSFNEMIDSTLIKFSSLVQTCFINENENTSQFSLCNTYNHSLLKEVFLTAYMKVLDDKHKKLSNNSNNDKAFIALSKDDFSNEAIIVIAKAIYNNNQMEQLEIKLNDVYTQTLNKIASLQLNIDTIAVIKEGYESKVNKLNAFSNNSLRNLVEKSISTIHDGYIVYEKKNVFDFRNVFNKVHTISNGVLYIDNTKLNELTCESVLMMLKYNKDEITKIHLSGAFDYDRISEKKIIQILYSMFLYASHILAFTITKCTNITVNLINVVMLVIQRFTNLKVLNLDNNNLNDNKAETVISHIKTNKTIFSLSMNGNNLSSQSGTYLSELLNMNNTIGSLYLANNNITSPGIIKLFTAIKTNTALNTFDISYNNLQGSDLEEVSTILGKDSNISSLNLAGNTMTLHSATEIGAVIGSSTQLKSINFANMNINEEMICNLLISKRLIMEEIIFDNNPLGDIALMSIANALTQNIKKVSIRKFNVISTCYAMLLNKINMFKGIEEIHLEDNAISEELFNLTIAFIAKNQIKTKLYFTQNMLAMDHNAIAAFGKVSNIIFE